MEENLQRVEGKKRTQLEVMRQREEKIGKGNGRKGKLYFLVNTLIYVKYM